MQFMENLYFPIFLVVLAVVVIWFFKKAGSQRANRESRSLRSPAGRTIGADALSRNTDRRGPSAPRSVVGKPKDIWQTRRERAAEESFGVTAPRTGVHHAGFLAPDDANERHRPRHFEVPDQQISDAEHLGIDEYLSKREGELPEEGAEAAGLSMTAVKYEPSGGSDSESGDGRKKRVSFKP